MSDLEYDVLDELYFVQSFPELRDKLEWDNETLKSVIWKLFEKRWIKCYISPTEEIDYSEIDIETQYLKYFYIASKEGLLAHNNYPTEH